MGFFGDLKDAYFESASNNNTHTFIPLVLNVKNGVAKIKKE